MIRRLFVSLGLLVCCSCGWPEEGVLVLSPSPGNAGPPGSRGVFGVALRTIEVQARIGEGFTCEWLVPAKDASTIDRSGAPYPIVLFLNGGAVPPARYRWLTTHLASRGFVVLAPQHVLDAPIMEAENAIWAYRSLLRRSKETNRPWTGLVNAESPVFLMGHSLGAITSAELYQSKTDLPLRGLVMLAGRLLDNTQPGTRQDGFALLLTGAQDGVITPEESQTAFGRLLGHRVLGIVAGMNHYDWSDDNSPSDLAAGGDKERLRPTEESRKDALSLLDQWLIKRRNNDDLKEWSPSAPRITLTQEDGS